MKRLSWLLIASLIVACDGGPSPVAPEAPNASLNVAASRGPLVGPDDWIVVFRDDVVDPPGLARQLIATHGGSLRFTYQYALKGFAATLPTQAIEGIRNNPNVAYVEADGVVVEDAITSSQSPATWGLDRIDQPILPLDNAYNYNFDGTGVTAYIIDTGIRTTHNEFGSSGGRASEGFDAIDGVLDGQDCRGHGTHVAGTVGGSTYGVAKNVTLVAVRVLNCQGSGSYSQVIAGIDWVTNNHVAPAVANMSLGGGFSTSLNDAVNGSVAAGVTYAVSAGNDNRDACTKSPASAADALTVGSTTSSDSRSSFSNFGTCVDIFAPGSSITSAYKTNDDATATFSGTSMSSPHVAGAAALRLEQCPGEAPGDVASAITGAATAGVISNTGPGSPDLLLYSLMTASCNAGGGGGVTDPTDVAIQSISPVSLSGKRNLNGSVVVTIGLGTGETTGPAADVTVTGDWYPDGGGTPVKTSSGVTGGSGQVSFSSGAQRGVTSLEFCVTKLDGDITNNTLLPKCSPYDNGSGGEGGGGGAGAPSALKASLVVKGKNTKAALIWAGGDATVAIYRNENLLTTVTNTGAFTDNLGKNPSGSFTYMVCNAGAMYGGAECSGSATVPAP
ncbi:MAG: S8 family serine peptidase [Gemmatimonadota bacterium]